MAKTTTTRPAAKAAADETHVTRDGDRWLWLAWDAGNADNVAPALARRYVHPIDRVTAVLRAMVPGEVLTFRRGEPLPWPAAWSTLAWNHANAIAEALSRTERDTLDALARRRTGRSVVVATSPAFLPIRRTVPRTVARTLAARGLVVLNVAADNDRPRVLTWLSAAGRAVVAAMEETRALVRGAITDATARRRKGKRAP